MRLSPAQLDAATAEARLVTDAQPRLVQALAVAVLHYAEAARRRAAPLPTHRRGVRYSPRIGGTAEGGGTRCYLTCDVVDGRVVAIWIDVEHKLGTLLVELGHVLARLASRALQAGAELADVIEDMRGAGGGPAGEVHDVDGITSASSIPDLVAQVLERARLDLERAQ